MITNFIQTSSVLFVLFCVYECAYNYSVFAQTIFKSNSEFMVIVTRRYRDLLYTPFPYTCIPSHIIDILHQNGTVACN